MYGMLIDGNEDLYVCDTTNGCLRKVRTSDGNVSTVQGISGKTNSKLSAPYGIALDLDGNLYVTELRSNEIKKVVNSGAMPYVMRKSIRAAFRLSRLLLSGNSKRQLGNQIDFENERK